MPQPFTSIAASAKSAAKSAPAPRAAAEPKKAAPVEVMADKAMRSFALQCVAHQRELYGMALRITRNPDHAGDLVQETLLRAMVAHESFIPGSNLRAWLLRILTNAFINGYRKRRRHHRLATERPGDALMALYGRDEDHERDPEVELTANQLGDEVRTALAKLGPQYREVVERADLRGEKYRDIADSLRVPIGTVMSRLFRARRELEAELVAAHTSLREPDRRRRRRAWRGAHELRSLWRPTRHAAHGLAPHQRTAGVTTVSARAPSATTIPTTIAPPASATPA
ncbi:MAG TPA: sigma-70 family RNA polymerase sigma factor, partial [Kofleriaceae bacterium]|nr:sigma-70 family RNA polymerase sigma factor [Kofleriaceae bacterium]